MIWCLFDLKFSTLIASAVLATAFSSQCFADDQLELFPKNICVGRFAFLAPPTVDGKTITHVLLGNYLNRRLSGGMHSWQGIESFKNFLRREYGLRDASIDRAVRVTEVSDLKPAKIMIDRQYLAGPSIPKSIFPRSWPFLKIIEAIENVAKAPDTSTLLPSGDRQLSGIYSGCRIELKVSPTGKIKTAYPSSNQAF